VVAASKDNWIMFEEEELVEGTNKDKEEMDQAFQK
jgi:hypothetical protein